MRLIVHKTKLFSNQVYLDFKNIYKLKTLLEESGLYPIVSNTSANNLSF
jgi:hypothetical protein